MVTTQQVAPIPLNAEQIKAVQDFARDDRLWTTQGDTEFNLYTFARVILKAQTRIPETVRPERTLPIRLGWMADAVLSAKLGPRARFFSRERVDELVLLLREAEKALLGVR